MIIDDEPLSRDVLRNYIGELKELTLVTECADAFEATNYLSRKRVDIIFLDINMPGLSGISFARSLTLSPLVIFTTAYPEHAVEGFDLNALDFLVKPFSFERFLKAVNRAQERLHESDADGGAPGKIIVKADKKIYAVEFTSMLFLEGQGDYIRIHLEDKKLVVHDTIKRFTESLPPEDFMRVHKSYVINLRKIDFIEGNQVRIKEHSIPVSPALKDDMLARL